MTISEPEPEGIKEEEQKEKTIHKHRAATAEQEWNLAEIGAMFRVGC